MLWPITPSIMLFLVGAMHSFLGGPRLIRPIMEKDDLPIILGSINNSRVTLWAGWHALTLFWWAQAITILTLTVAPELFIPAAMGSLAIAAFIMGGCAIIMSKGLHKSWLLFFPLAIASTFTAWIHMGAA